MSDENCIGDAMTSNSDPMAATLLSVSASAYAAYAANLLLEKSPDARLQLGDAAFAHWKEHFGNRIQELSAAIAEGSIELFESQIRWSRTAFRARQVPDSLLRDSLVCLAEVLEEELPEANRQVPGRFIEAAVKSFEEQEPEVAELDAANAVSKLALEYLAEALEGNSRAAIDLVLSASDRGLSLDQIYQAIMTAQGEIGRMWHRAEVSIAEEHVVTSTTRRLLAVLAHRAERESPNGLTVVAAAVVGNAHDIGVRMVSDYFEIAGWRAVCLGSDLPPAEIALATVSFEANLVLLSAAISTQLSAVRETIESIRQVKPRCKVLVGGSALRNVTDLWSQLGADGFAANPAEALASGSQLVQKGTSS